jgi:hypothetical protein
VKILRKYSEICHKYNTTIPTKCLWIEKSIKEDQGPIRTVEASGKKNTTIILFTR